MEEGSINNRFELLVIGGSAGSLEVILQLLPAFNETLNLAIVIVLHRKPGESLLTQLLESRTHWQVKEVEEKDVIEKRNIYIAPADYHLMIEKDKTFSLDFSEKINFSRPSIDVTFETAADAFAGSMIAVLLSGANADGVEGLHQVKAAGGLTIVQDPAEASVSYMPQHAIDFFSVDYIAKTNEIVDIINRVCQ